MKNKQKYLDEFNNILPDYLSEIKSEKRDINQQNFIEITNEILQLISLQTYHSEAKNTLINLCEQLHDIEKIMPYDYCLFTGRMRIIYTFLKVYESLQEEKYLAFAKSFFVKGKVIDYVTTSQNFNGLLKGRLGTFMGLLYLKKYASELELGDITDSIFDEIIKNLAIDKHGLNNFYPELHINSITNLASGNAGLIWFFTTLSNQKSKKEIKKILESLCQSLNGQWSMKWSNWKDNYMKIASINDHFIHINQFEKGNISYFNIPKNNYEYWQGSLGICISLVNYLIQLSFKNSQLLDKIERNLKSIERKENNTYILENVKELFYLYTSLFRITNDIKYELKAYDLLKNPALKKSTKISLLLCILNDNDVEQLDILPTFNNFIYLRKDLSENIQKSLIIRYYPKTVTLLNHLDKKYFKLHFLKNDNELSAKFFQNFETNFENCSLIKTNQHRKILKDSFKLERFKWKKVVKHQNKIFLKVQEIVQFSQANQVLNLEESDLLEKEFIVADNVYLLETKWNWFKIDKIPLDEVLKIPSSNYYGLIKIKPNNEQKTVLALSENQLIFLEIFYEKTSIKQAKVSFLDNFDIKSESERENLLVFMEDTIEQFIFNRFIVLKE
jgi:predicted SnoaL-like aldol condensation-catalyzing enzyme